MFETNTIDLPSGDQSAPPPCRVMKSFSIDSVRSTCRSCLLVICLGSVIACETGRPCAASSVLMKLTIANAVRLRMEWITSEQFLLSPQTHRDTETQRELKLFRVCEMRAIGICPNLD